MTTELEKKFFDAFGIKCNILEHQQFNYAQVPRGLEFFKTREKLVDAGMIKIGYKKLTPTPANDCIYWGEYHYPTITDRILLELICIESQVNKAHNTYSDVENLKEHILVGLRPFTEKCYHQVRELFGEGEEE